MNQKKESVLYHDMFTLEQGEFEYVKTDSEIGICKRYIGGTKSKKEIETYYFKNGDRDWENGKCFIVNKNIFLQILSRSHLSSEHKYAILYREYFSHDNPLMNANRIFFYECNDEDKMKCHKIVKLCSENYVKYLKIEKELQEYKELEKLLDDRRKKLIDLNLFV